MSTMTTAQTSNDDSVQTLSITRGVDIAASPEVVFGSLLAELGPESEMPDGTPFPMKLEAWPGGRWYRDLGPMGGHTAGHLWGHVQVIKPPTLLELCGPMFMSYPAVSHVQYRLAKSGAGTRLTVLHRAMGLITDEHRRGVSEGWQHELDRVKAAAERRAKNG
jgi:uncharacterized protein YndB with AHSA1/START domain